MVSGSIRQVPSNPASLACTTAFLCLAVLIDRSGFAFAQETTDLATQIENLAEREGFELRRVDRLEGAPADPAGCLPEETGASLKLCLNRLLADFNTVTAEASDGRVASLRILGRRQGRARQLVSALPPVKPQVSSSSSPAKQQGNSGQGAITISTQRYETGHWVEVWVSGPLGEAIAIPLKIDSAGNRILLPGDVAEELGFGDDDLEAGMSGRGLDAQPAALAILPILELGDLVLRDLPTAFIYQRAYLNEGVLGLGALEGYSFHLDDAEGTLTLRPID